MNNLLNNIPIKAKIIGKSLILFALILVGSGYALYAMTQIGNELEAIAEEDILLTENLTAITEHQFDQARHFKRALRFIGFYERIYLRTSFTAALIGLGIDFIRRCRALLPIGWAMVTFDLLNSMVTFDLL